MEQPSTPPEELHRLATAIRLRAVEMVSAHGLGYLGQALSSAEEFAALYSVSRAGIDRIVVSPGHYVIGAFAAAAETGLLDRQALSSYGYNDSSIDAIGGERSPGMAYTCGSLGQGLSAAAGFTLADRLRHEHDRRTFVLISDGELQEGQVWEAAMFAGHHALNRLVAVIDANNSQVDGPVDTITTIEPIAQKWESFGWQASEVDGHDAAAIYQLLQPAQTSRPQVIVCRTSTRHGLNCLPDSADGHFITMSPELSQAALAELMAELDNCNV
ncbi:MAG TPA: 1-deoxy-D-xylulose-5-phosphate synthase N-terminal domain-containing protein [Jatrophihabitans sp.]|jgi:transketolase